MDDCSQLSFLLPPKLAPGLCVITTHVNADFDAFASMLAAQKLYPEAKAVFPGTQEPSLRNFFIQSMVYFFNLAEVKDIDLKSIRTLVLVDTRQPGRIGPFAAALDNPGLTVHLFDHHPDAPGDILGDFRACGARGATATILTEILGQAGAHLTADEATVMAMGIYEDTGSFTFSSTTPEDFRAAESLLRRGANLNMVASMMSREINPQQIGLLNDMIQAMVRHMVHGVEVAVTVISGDEYINDFAVLVHKLRNMENLDALFAIARMGSRITVVARSRIAEVDVGHILAEMGGGGHANAASANLRDRDLFEVEHEVLALLEKHVRPRQQARDIMSTPVIRVRPAATIADAKELLAHYNINALVVTDGPPEAERLLGYITRQVIDKALHHQLTEVPVAEYMTQEIAHVSPDADLPTIQQAVLDRKQRLLPVLEDGRILGVITRTDLLNILVNETYRMPSQAQAGLSKEGRAREKNLEKLLRERLPDDVYQRIRQVGDLADERGMEAFLVGGFVRDLLLMNRNLDIDVVVEGDGVAFARELCRRVGGRLHSHEVFGTAVVSYPDGFKLDVATARFEYYQAPASLPQVEVSSLKLDLYRRDFTINTLVIQVNRAKFGTLIDFFGAQRDIKSRSIRVLHNLSFVEDPTRIFRAIRFEQRFGFTIGKHTAALIENAVKMDFISRLSGRRIATELRLILAEDNPMNAIARMQAFDILRFVHPALTADDKMTANFVSAQNVMAWYDLLYLSRSYRKWAVSFLVFVNRLTGRQVEVLCRDLEMAPRHVSLFVDQRNQAKKLLAGLERKRGLKNSVLYAALKTVPLEVLLYMMAVTGSEAVRQGISRFITKLSRTSSEVTGKDLMQMGIKPGPVYKKVLGTLLDARLDDKVKTRDEEMKIVMRILAQQGRKDQEK
ncbi:MAG: CBS domain-containing protein [Thermodesulfobacteriota bacterium]